MTGLGDLDSSTTALSPPAVALAPIIPFTTTATSFFPSSFVLEDVRLLTISASSCGSSRGSLAALLRLLRRLLIFLTRVAESAGLRCFLDVGADGEVLLLRLDRLRRTWELVSEDEEAATGSSGGMVAAGMGGLRRVWRRDWSV